MTEKPCQACGAWWLPGAEQCPKHRPDALPYVEERDGRTVLVQALGAPRVYAEPDPFGPRGWFALWGSVRQRLSERTTLLVDLAAYAHSDPDRVHGAHRHEADGQQREREDHGSSGNVLTRHWELTQRKVRAGERRRTRRR